MTARVSWILLALSGTFNAFFTGGFLYARSSSQQVAQADEGRVKLVAERLALTPEQRQSFAQLRREFAAEADRLRQAIALAREERFAELAADRPDRQRIRRINQRLLSLHMDYRELAAAYRQRFVQILTPAQRRAMVELFRRRLDRAAPLRRLRQRFDTDGDGILSPRERAAAAQRLRAARGRMAWRLRQRLLWRFDFNGDGRLDERERAAARKALEQWRTGSGPLR